MFTKLFTRRINDTHALFKEHFVEVKALYAIQFDRVPCVSFIGELNATSALAFLRERFNLEATAFLQHAYFDHEAQKMFLNNTIIVLTKGRIIEVGNNYVQLLHRTDQYEWAIRLIKELSAFRTEATPAGIPAKVVGFARQTTLN